MRILVTLLGERMEIIDRLDNDILSEKTEDVEIEEEVVNSGEYRRTIQEVIIQLLDSLEKLTTRNNSNKVVKRLEVQSYRSCSLNHIPGIFYNSKRFWSVFNRQFTITTS